MIVLIGFMGAGKSSVGRLLARRLGLPFVDTDAIVATRDGRSIARIFEDDGEPVFRELEREAAHEALGGPDAVVALGGGALADPVICGLIQDTTVVHLDVSYAEAMRRLGDDPERPMLAREPRDLYTRRDGVYRMLSDMSVATDARTAEEVALDIAVRVAGPYAADEKARRVTVGLGDRSYDVVIGRDIADRLGELVPRLPDAEKAFLVTHRSLDRHSRAPLESLEQRGYDVETVFVAEGEASKSLEAAGSLYESLAGAGAHRHDLIVTLGGGVISDLGGFVASTYARGMPLVHVPSTLLGQVDAAIGGKTGINLSHAKNLVGTVYQPTLVVCDVDLLASCPRDEMRSGLAEVIKYGFIADPELLDVVSTDAAALLDGDAPKLIDVVSRSVAIKAAIVPADELEQGSRAHLNYGHTFAHAIERAAKFGGIRHGEAVALGMMAAAYLALELGRIDEELVALHEKVLAAVGLPVRASLDLDELEAAWRLDKKYRRGMRFVLLAGLGKPEANVEVPRDALEKTIERLGE